MFFVFVVTLRFGNFAVVGNSLYRVFFAKSLGDVLFDVFGEREVGKIGPGLFCSFDTNDEFAAFGKLRHISQPAAYYLFVNLADFAYERDFAIAENRVQKVKVFFYVVRRAVKNNRTRKIFKSLGVADPIRFLFGQEPRHAERRRVESAEYHRVYKRARSADYRIFEFFCNEFADKHAAGVGHDGHTRVGHERKVFARLEPRDHLFAFGSLVELLVGNKRFFDVVAIDDRAFYKNRKIRRVLIGTNIQLIGKMAFYGTRQLRYIDIRTKKLKVIGKKAFIGIYPAAKIKIPRARKKKYIKLLANKYG